MDDHRELKYSVVVVIVTINGILLAALGFAAEATVPRIYKPGIFAAGASFVLVIVVLEIVYLVATSSRTDKPMNEIE
ncbi:hypothetical protein Tco_0844867 [Tanacetum coccineum]